MPDTTLKDLVIVGGGPAGLSAAIYAQRSLLDAVTLEREALGGQAILTSEIDNYPGLPHTDGYTLSDAMRAQAEDLGAQIVMDPVSSIEHDPETGRFDVVASTARYDAAAVKHVFVIGGGNSAAEEALFLARLAAKVTLIVRKDHLRAQAAVVRELEQNEKVELRLLTSIVALDGGDLPSSVTFRDNATGSTHVETYEEGSFGVFVLVGRDPETELVRGLADVDDAGYVVTDERMATRTPGLFVAGDARVKPLRQIVTAASDGAVAATSAAAYLGLPVEG